MRRLEGDTLLWLNWSGRLSCLLRSLLCVEQFPVEDVNGRDKTGYRLSVWPTQQLAELANCVSPSVSLVTVDIVVCGRHESLVLDDFRSCGILG